MSDLKLKPCPFCGGQAILKLKPCPFCGGQAIVRHATGYATNSKMYEVRCKNNKEPACLNGTWGHDSEEKAISAWNRRAPSPEMAAFIQAADAMRDELCHQGWCRAEEGFECRCNTENIRMQYDAARKGIE